MSSLGLNSMTWNEFNSFFLDKYFPTMSHEAKLEEFLSLYQGNMTVMVYEALFIALSRFAHDLVSTNFKKACRFECGVRPFLRSKITILRLPTNDEVVEIA